MGNLPANIDIDSKELEAVFSMFGQVIKIDIIKNRENGKSKGFAFISFAEDESVNSAISCPGIVIFQR